MNFWIFGSNKTIIAYDRFPVIKAVNSNYARLICNELNSGIKQINLISKDIVLNNGNVTIGNVINLYENIYNIFNPNNQISTSVKITPQNNIQDNIIIEEIPLDEKKEPIFTIPSEDVPVIKVDEPDGDAFKFYLTPIELTEKPKKKHKSRKKK